VASLEEIERDLARGAGDFPHDPIVGPPARVPIAFDPPTFLETPDYQRSGIREGPGSPYFWRDYGWPYPILMDAAQRKAAADRRLSSHRHVLPADTPERIRYWDELRCVDLPPQRLVTTGTAFELVRVHLQKFGTGVVERISTIFDDVTALDGEGVPLFSFGPLPGNQPCILPLAHPDPAAGVLAVQFRLVVSELPDFSLGITAGVPPYQGPLPPAAIPSDENLRPPWSELRQGYDVLWSDLLQHVVGVDCLVRLWIIVFAQPNRWALRVGGRLAGYWNSAGRLGVALDAATRRTL